MLTSNSDIDAQLSGWIISTLVYMHNSNSASNAQLKLRYNCTPTFYSRLCTNFHAGHSAWLKHCSSFFQKQPQSLRWLVYNCYALSACFQTTSPCQAFSYWNVDMGFLTCTTISVPAECTKMRRMLTSWHKHGLQKLPQSLTLTRPGFEPH